MNDELDILLLADSPDDEELIMLVLKEQGLVPCMRRVETWEEFLKALDHKPDLILSQSLLQGFTAIDALRRLKASGLDIPFIFVTDSIQAEQGIEAIKEGADDYVFKDGMDRIGHAIRRALSARQARLEAARAQESLRKQKEFLATLIECIPIPVFYKDQEGKYLGFNKAYEEFVGIKREDVLGKTVFDLLPPEAAILHHSMDRALLKSGQSARYETRLEGKDGRAREILISKAPFTVPLGEGSGIISAFMDLTELKEAERALRNSEEKYRLLAESSRDIILIHDMDGFILYSNKTGLELAGFTEEEALGRNILDFMPPDQRAQALARRDSRSAGYLAPYLYETEFLNRSGERVPVEVISAPIVKEGKASSLLLVARDITERKKAEAERESLRAQLAQAQKMEAVARLAGGVAHDFNNMLSAIIGFSEIAMARLQKDDPVQKDLMEVLTAARRSADIVRQLLAFVRKQKSEPRVLDLNSTIEGLLKMLRRLLGENIELAWKPKPGLWSVLMDPSHVDRILANLCVNAKDAIEGEGRIIIETMNVEMNVDLDEHCSCSHEGCTPGRYVALCVSDNGCGIPKEILPKIFDPFFTTKAEGKGTGLGLSTVYGIVKQNLGFINVYSEPANGSVFKIYLPAYQSETKTHTDPGRKDLPLGKGETILIVEDELSVLNVTNTILKRLGYNTLLARSPEDAINIASAHKGDIPVLITDVIMPRMNGRELAEMIKRLRPNIKVIFMSGYTADYISHLGVMDKGVDFIAKPLSRDKLATKLSELLGNS